MWPAIRIIVHLLPLIPFFYGKIYFGIASILGVALFYIKTFKLTEVAASHPDDGSGEREAILRQRDRWRRFTFLEQ